MTVIVQKTSAIHNFNSIRRIDRDLANINIKTKRYSKTWLIILIASLIISIMILWPQAARLTAMENQVNTIDVSKIIELSNIERERENLSDVHFNSELTKLAQIRAQDMRNKKYFDHSDPEGHGLKYFLEQVDYNYLIVGENLAINFRDNNKVVDAWMNSKTHRQNIMNPLFDEIGLYYDTINTSTGEKPIIVMILGRKLDS